MVFHRRAIRSWRPAYRSEYELAVRFGRSPQGDGRYAVESYLDHHAGKLAARFDPGS